MKQKERRHQPQLNLLDSVLTKLERRFGTTLVFLIRIFHKLVKKLLLMLSKKRNNKLKNLNMFKRKLKSQENNIPSILDILNNGFDYETLQPVLLDYLIDILNEKKLEGEEKYVTWYETNIKNRIKKLIKNEHLIVDSRLNRKEEELIDQILNEFKEIIWSAEDGADLSDKIDGWKSRSSRVAHHSLYIIRKMGENYIIDFFKNKLGIDISKIFVFMDGVKYYMEHRGDEGISNIININDYIDIFKNKIDNIIEIIRDQYGITDDLINSTRVQGFKSNPQAEILAKILDDLFRNIKKHLSQNDDAYSKFMKLIFINFIEVISTGNKFLKLKKTITANLDYDLNTRLQQSVTYVTDMVSNELQDEEHKDFINGLGFALNDYIDDKMDGASTLALIIKIIGKNLPIVNWFVEIFTAFEEKIEELEEMVEIYIIQLKNIRQDVLIENLTGQIDVLDGEFKKNIDDLDEEFKNNIAVLDGEFKNNIEVLDGEFKNNIEVLREDFGLLNKTNYDLEQKLEELSGINDDLLGRLEALEGEFSGGNYSKNKKKHSTHNRRIHKRRTQNSRIHKRRTQNRRTHKRRTQNRRIHKRRTQNRRTHKRIKNNRRSHKRK